MTLFRRLILSLALLAGIAPALAQVPPPVPALPDSERRTSYSISGTTCACNVNFALYGDSTDYQNWLEVYLNGVNVAFNDPTFGWAITSPSGSLSTLARPITNAVLTFTNAQTGTVQIVGARRPRRTVQFAENAGVSARNLNQAFTDIIAMQRETWDKTNDVTGRAVLARPGETLALLPVLASRQNQGACFDSGGNLTSCVSVPSSTFSAGTGIAFTGTNPTTINNNIQAGAGIALSGTNPLTISTTRAPLSADTPYYVRATGGSDANCSGLANVVDPGSGSLPRACAWQTLQKASDTIVNAIDLNGHNVTVDITGSFTSGVLFGSRAVGGGNITFTSTAGATITTTNANAIAAANGILLTVGGNITLSAVTSGICLYAYDNGIIEFSAITFSACATTQIQAGSVTSNSGIGTITATGSYTISGGSSLGGHMHATVDGSTIRLASGITVTLTGTPAFPNFFAGITKGFIWINSVTFTGSATGPRYLIHRGGVLFGPASRTALPGDAAGTVAAGGIYAIDDTDSDFGVGNVLATKAILSSSPTSGIGYATASGGVVTQATSKATGVTLNTTNGAITLNNAALGAGNIVTFVLTDSAIAATDLIATAHESGGTTGPYTINGRATGSGTAAVDVRNNSAGSLSEAIVIRFVVIKSVNN